MKDVKKRLQDAIDFLNGCEKYGIEVDIEGLSDMDIIALADEMQNASEAAYESWKETWEADTYDENGCDPGGHPNAEIIAKRLNI
jgi:hypothetical protein